MIDDLINLRVHNFTTARLPPGNCCQMIFGNNSGVEPCAPFTLINVHSVPDLEKDLFNIVMIHV